MAVPVFDISRILGWVKTAAADVAKFVAFRLLMISIVTVLVPWAIYQAWLMISEQVITFLVSQAGDAGLWSGQMIELTGFGAWLGVRLRFAECFTVLATAASFAFIMRIVKR
jgi:hypothetical protein